MVLVPPWCSSVWFSAHSAYIPATKIRSSREVNVPYTSWGHLSSLGVLSAQICLWFYLFLWNYVNIIGRVRVNYSIEYKIPFLKTRASISTLEKSFVFLFPILSSVKIKFLYQVFTTHTHCVPGTGIPRWIRETPFLHGTHDLAAGETTHYMTAW